MTDLRTAAQQALEALEGGADSWQLVGPAIDALRAALAEPVTALAAERDAVLRQLDDDTNQTLRVKRKRWAALVRLMDAQLQRKPLAEWQINDLMADIDPEDRDSWSFRQGVYAAEKHHGVRK